MKKIVGIVSEYNPFHAGHEYHIRQTRALLGEESTVVCVMSGDFVQRGEWAIQPKALRARNACEGGADAVVELPLPWCVSSAQRFASGAVGLLAACGITHLSFGSEEGELGPLLAVAETIAQPGFDSRVKDRMKKDPTLTYPAARSLETGSRILSTPNNLLAVEYLLALRGTGIKPLTVRRIGSGHDSEAGGDYPSASDIRKRILKGELPVPHADPERLSLAALSRLRMFDRSYFEALPDAGDGLGNRIWEAVQRASAFSEVSDLAKTKRYTHSRVRRCVMCAVLGIRKGLNEGLPPYARILAVNEKGRAWLASARGEMAIPVLTQPKQILRLDERAREVFASGASAHDFYSLGFALQENEKCGADYRTGPYIG